MNITELKLALEIPEGFIPIDNFPYRGPLVLAEAIRPFVRDKVFCDLGCGAGDIVELLVPYAKKAIGLERSHKLAERAKGRNFELVIGRFPQTIPEAEVYYTWTKSWRTLAEIFQNRQETLIVGGRKEGKVAAPSIHAMHDEYNAAVYEFNIGKEEVRLNPKSRMQPTEWQCKWHIAVMQPVDSESKKPIIE